MHNFEIHPIFPSTLAVAQVSEDFSRMTEIIKSEEHYDFISSDGGVDVAESKTYMTRSRTVLNDFPEERRAICAYFERFKNEVLRYEKADFALTTSWATKSYKGALGHFHAHWNSFFSGVLYLDMGDESAPIEFHRPTSSSAEIHPGSPVEWNTHNCQIWRVQPRKGMLIFFPSYLQHRIGPHKSGVARYSLAFNFFPTGLFGEGDSAVRITHEAP